MEAVIQYLSGFVGAPALWRGSGSASCPPATLRQGGGDMPGIKIAKRTLLTH